MLSKTELGMIAKLLGMASDSFGNNICNDFALPATPENLVLVKQAEGESEGGPYVKGDSICTQDWLLTDHLRKRCEEEASRF